MQVSARSRKCIVTSKPARYWDWDSASLTLKVPVNFSSNPLPTQKNLGLEALRNFQGQREIIQKLGHNGLWLLRTHSSLFFLINSLKGGKDQA